MPARIKYYLLVAKPGIVVGNLISPTAAGFFPRLQRAGGWP